MSDIFSQGARSALALYKGVESIKEKKQREEMLDRLINLEGGQTKLFNTFEKEIKTIQEGPFYIGLTYLERSKDDHRNLEESEEMLRNALKEFIKAYGVQRAKTEIKAFDSYFKGFIQSYISITWLMLESPNDAKIWIDKSMVSLQEAQTLFRHEIAVFKREILDFQSENNEHDRKMNDSIIYAGLDFVFGNESLDINKKKVNDHTVSINHYSKAQSESYKFMNEMKELSKQIEHDLLTIKHRESKEEIKSTVKGVLDKVPKMNKIPIERKTKNESISSVEKRNHIKSVLNKFKK